MNNKAMIGWMLACVIGVAIAGLSPADAQSTIGGAKTQQNKIGGAAKPPPVVGGAVKSITPASPLKPGPVAGRAKPNSPAGTPPAIGNGMTPGQSSAALKPNPPVTPPNKGNTVVTASSTPKCTPGTCAPKAPKP
jgi:hypothetical protein